MNQRVVIFFCLQNSLEYFLWTLVERCSTVGMRGLLKIEELNLPLILFLIMYRSFLAFITDLQANGCPYNVRET